MGGFARAGKQCRHLGVAGCTHPFEKAPLMHFERGSHRTSEVWPCQGLDPLVTKWAHAQTVKTTPWLYDSHTRMHNKRGGGPEPKSLCTKNGPKIFPSLNFFFFFHSQIWIRGGIRGGGSIVTQLDTCAPSEKTRSPMSHSLLEVSLCPMGRVEGEVKVEYRVTSRQK